MRSVPTSLIFRSAVRSGGDWAPFKHAVRLGAYHGRADRSYVDRFGVEFWGVPEEQMCPSPRFSREITDEGPFR